MAGGEGNAKAEGQDGLRANSRVNAVPDDRSSWPITAIVLTALGGMLLFLGFFFALVVGLGIGGFLFPSLGTLTAGGLMVIAGYRSWERSRERTEIAVERERERLLCDYCGGQNAEGSLKCESCGAPLR